MIRRRCGECGRRHWLDGGRESLGVMTWEEMERRDRERTPPWMRPTCPGTTDHTHQLDPKIGVGMRRCQVCGETWGVTVA